MYNILRRRRSLYRLISLAIGSLVFALCAPSLVHAADPLTLEAVNQKVDQIQVNVDTVWVLVTGFIVFFMQCGFALLEAGLVRQTGVVNTLAENFIDAGTSLLGFWAVGFGIAFGTSAGGIIGTDNFFLSQAIVFKDGGIEYAGMTTVSASINMFAFFFFQYAFSATATTITTGAMAERTDFIGDLIYTFIIGAFIYPVVVHWGWNGEGWLAKLSYHDFAGSSIVHSVGGWLALVGAYLLGPRPNRVWGQMPPAHNLAYATLGTLILWFGWYGFNPGSALAMNNPGLVSLVSVNTSLAAGAGSVSAFLYVYWRFRQWHLFCGLNGCLAGLVAITAGCAFVMPWAAVLIGAVAGVLVIVSVDVVEWFEIDDPVGAFSVHGANGMMGTLAVGFLGQPELTLNGKAGSLLGGGLDLLLVQLGGVMAIALFTILASFVMFGTLKAMGRLRVAKEADALGIDLYEHGASVWPDVYSPDEEMLEEGQAEGEKTVIQIGPH
jgi:Amt family ammonium transporter